MKHKLVAFYFLLIGLVFIPIPPNSAFAVIPAADKALKIIDKVGTKSYDFLKKVGYAYDIRLVRTSVLYSSLIPIGDLISITPLFKNILIGELSLPLLQKIRLLGLSQNQIKALDKALFINNKVLLGAMNLDNILLDVWRITKEADISKLNKIKQKFLLMGYDDFTKVELLKYVNNNIYGSGKIYCDKTITSDVILNGSPLELPFLDKICKKNNTIAFSPKSITQAAFDGFLLNNLNLIQLKTTNFKNWIKNINSAYTSAKNNNILDIHLYVELQDMTIQQIERQWSRATSAPLAYLKKDNIISKIICNGTDGWIELDLNLIK